MRKYLLRYLIFWLPAIVVAYFFHNSSMPLQVLQWFFAFFMLFGWAANTAAAAYHYPNSTLSALLAYAGFHLIAINVVYTTDFRSGLHIVLRALSGLFSFKALGVFKAVADSLDWYGELAVVVLVCACCLLGYLAGLLRRRTHPNPYRPRIVRKNP